ncbi:non-specific lipid transfer protein GPI-anchored 1-like [Hibiscus syriacus]|uniref:non-specific lipid transfer protein GPI-anchored 1-like n=1 Tax=Hibiscus syriacus TaxID=106335 RepID=UPI001923F188|nr:non-specific lipid transfer protein GPI-anchored 1-like [Hibiscus syriacus]
MDVRNQCAKDFQSVMSRQNFAQGKAETPSKECCSSVSSVKENEPKCLYYILQQSQTSGSQSLKSMGVMQDKLFQLPSACKLKNASVSDCPMPSSSGSQSGDDNSGGAKL